ncbi:hypothetical protein GCM10022198_11340 [Klugiella xanthotipulae]|uniref:Uncharacterized protein n=1 Tax=Klugiella xanthotipulae TaxID=244735 RepID=A0A543HYY5_9MICO|nr:hypothetical protein [Klugiella xanthotipulae]TQM63528.1 hypothetical protein FB466_1793 [Klugiella xanthotipulae]
MIDAAHLPGDLFTTPGTEVIHRSITASEVLPRASRSLIVAAWPAEEPSNGGA